ncbi:MAG TPA: bile acid:sodium symporter [Gammaproteobacteria bacterium]|nr:bile acid:sodium symporter [Gammaproteobacteria bacterium]
MSTIAEVVVVVFLVASMAGIGLRVSAAEVREALRLRGFLGRALVANFLVIPMIGVALTRLVPMQPELAVAFVLLACSPGGPSALQFTSKQQTALAHAGITAFVLSLLAVFLTPLLVQLALPRGTSLVVPYGRVFWLFFLLLLAPLGLGMLLRSLAPALAGRIARPVVLASTLAFFAFIGLTLALRRTNMAALKTEALLALLAFVLVSMAIGWLLGGPGRPGRRVLATASSMRNVALCLAIARHSFPGTDIEVPLVAFSALMIPPNMAFFLVTRLSEKR